MPDALPFGVGGPAEPEVSASPLVGNLIAGLLNIPKHLIDASAEAVPGLRKEDVTDNPNAPEPNAPLYKAAADTAMTLAGTGAPGAEAGAAGIFGGKLAKTADIPALIEANKMRELGEPSERIWNDTGWFKSPTDSKWRFEIPDTSSKVASHGLDYTKEGSFYAGPSEAMFDHPDLYQAYPLLKYNKVYNTVYQNPKNGIGRGSYDPNPIGAKVIEAAAPDKLRMQSVMLHELQHAVQGFENFAPGGQPSTFARLKETFPQKLPLTELQSDPQQMYQRLAGEVEARNVQERHLQQLANHNARQIPPWYSSSMDTPYANQLVYDPNTDLVKSLRHLK